ALDWLLRAVRPEDGFMDWYRRMTEQKKAALPGNDSKAGPADEGAAACEHEAALRLLARQHPDLIAVQELPGPVPAWAGAPPTSAELAAETPPTLPLSWRFTSFSALAGPQDGTRGHRDPNRDAFGGTGQALAMAAFPSGSRAGECLHDVLEHWNFQDEPTHLEATLLSHGLVKDLPQGLNIRTLLEQELPRWAQAKVPGLGPLRLVAAQASLSEWHFVLPLGPQGLDGKTLATVFQKHPDPRLRAYSASLQNLAPESVRGMLQGYLDRLARFGGTWGVLDWKSNRLGDYAEDFREERLFEEAAAHHYILQVYLYLVALRRHLRARGGTFRLDGGSLVFLRALEPGSSRGVLRFDANEDFLNRLDALFAGEA
ncbi:MAG: PD-(D/E)XK nuclease family protein, partial [bacterium]